MKHSIILIIGVLILYTCGYQPGQRAEKPGQSDESNSKKSKRTHGKQYGHGRGGFIGFYDENEKIKKIDWNKKYMEYLKKLPVLKINKKIYNGRLGIFTKEEIAVISGDTIRVKYNEEREIVYNGKSSKLYNSRKIKKGLLLKVSLKYAKSPSPGQTNYREAKEFTKRRLQNAIILVYGCDGSIKKGVKCLVKVKYSILYPVYSLHSALLLNGMANDTKYAKKIHPDEISIKLNISKEWSDFYKKVMTEVYGEDKPGVQKYRNQIEFPEIEFPEIKPKDDSENIEDEE
ncbi:MAG: hypothetical protein OEZ36_00185 [Spirochaetota bacterium]|nr:hypothetical protein [Spirochaetota bacterium]